MQSWLEGRNWVGKCAKATEMTASLRILSSKADSNTWESFTRSELKLESVHQESPRSDIFRKRATKPLLTQKHRQKHLTWDKEKNNWTVAQWSKVLFSDESTFGISFLNQGPRVWTKRGETQNPRCLRSSVKFPQSVMIWSAMSSAGVGPLCFLKCFCQRYQKLVQWLRCYCAWLASKLAWTEPHRESMEYCQEEDERHQTQQCRWPEGRYQSNLGFITPEQCHRLITSIPRRIDAVILAKGGQTKYWVHLNEDTFQKPYISV